VSLYPIKLHYDCCLLHQSADIDGLSLLGYVDYLILNVGLFIDSYILLSTVINRIVFAHCLLYNHLVLRFYPCLKPNCKLTNPMFGLSVFETRFLSLFQSMDSRNSRNVSVYRK
jgi:hypothetical protein